MVENLITLFMLVLLQAVLGFDNLLYISLESQRVKPEKQDFVRKVGIALAVVLRIILLFVVLQVIEAFQNPVFGFHYKGIFEGVYNVHSIIVLFGGIFIIYTALKEIWHMVLIEEGAHMHKKEPSSVGKIITLIVLMNLVFSFDSILSALALTDVFWIMALAIVIGGILMIWLSNKVATFLKKNRMYEVLGLFILFVVGIMLLTEGGHLAHMKIAGNPITPMSKTTFYFVIVIMIIIDIVQGRYQKKLLAQHQKEKMQEYIDNGVNL